MPERFATLPEFKTQSGITWNFIHEGTGEALVFIHGWGMDGRIWRQQIKHFSEKFQVISLDLPGHGKSSWQKVDLKTMVMDIKKLLEALEIKKVNFVGSSLGGLVMLKYYEAFPKDVSRMIFVGSMPKFSKSEDYPFGLDVPKMRKLGDQVEDAYPAIVDVFFRSLFTREERESRRFKWMQKFRRTTDAPMQASLIEYLDILEQEDLRNVLPTIAVPAQFMNGREDQICTFDAVEFIKTLLPQAHYHYFEKCGHFPFLSKAYEFNEVLDQFILESKT